MRNRAQRSHGRKSTDVVPGVSSPDGARSDPDSSAASSHRAADSHHAAAEIEAALYDLQTLFVRCGHHTSVFAVARAGGRNKTARLHVAVPA